jgi:hypothetical protein
MVNICEPLFDVPLVAKQPNDIDRLSPKGKRARYDLDNVGHT